jgi:hypothetical protein
MFSKGTKIQFNYRGLHTGTITDIIPLEDGGKKFVINEIVAADGAPCDTLWLYERIDEEGDPDYSDFDEWQVTDAIPELGELGELGELVGKCFPYNNPRPTRETFTTADAEYRRVKILEGIDQEELYRLSGMLGRYEIEVNPTWRSAHEGPVERWTSV